MTTTKAKAHHVRRFYGDLPILHPATFLRDARRLLKDVDFDTVVGTGLSGVPAATLLGRSMHKHILLVRKEDDTHNHHNSTGKGVVGELGERWVFVDDFVSSGETRHHVKAAVEHMVEDWWSPAGDEPPTTTYVGSYLFRGQRSWDEEPVFVYANQE